MNKSNLGDMSGFSNKRIHQQPSGSSYWNDQPPQGSSSAAVCNSKLDLSLDAVYNPEVSTNFSPHEPPVIFLGPRHPMRFSSPDLLPNAHQSQFHRSEQPRPSRYQQPPAPCYPQQPTGVFSYQQLTVAHSHGEPSKAQSQQPTEILKQQQPPTVHCLQPPTVAQRLQAPTVTHRQQQPTVVQRLQQQSMVHNYEQQIIARGHQQPYVAQSHQQPTVAVARGHQQPAVAVTQGLQQSTSFPFPKPRPMPPLYRYPVPHQRHPQPAHQEHLQLTPNPLNMSNMPQYYQNIRRRVISDMNYRNIKSRSFREEFGGKNRADIGSTTCSPVSVIQKVWPPTEHNITSKNNKLKRVGSVSSNLNANDSEELNRNKSGEDFHLMKTGQELARMCFSVEVGCQTDLSFPLDVEIVLMPVEALNDLITAPQDKKSELEQNENGKSVLLKSESSKSENTTAIEVTDKSTTVVENEESFQESPVVVPLCGDRLQDLTQDDKNSNPDHHIKEDSRKLVCEPKVLQEQECSSKECIKTDCTVTSEESTKENAIQQNGPRGANVQMSQGEQTQRKRPQCLNLDFNVSPEVQLVSEKPSIQDLYTKRESKVSESKKEKVNCDNPTRDSKDKTKTSRTTIIEDVGDPKSKSDIDSSSGSCYFSDFVNTDLQDEVESFNPLANFVTLMSYTDPDIEAELTNMNHHASEEAYNSDADIEAELSNMNHHASISPGAKLFEQHYYEEACKFDQYNLEHASNSEQGNSEKESLNDQYNLETVFYSEQDNPKYAFHSEQDYPRNALHSEHFNSEEVFQSEQFNSEKVFHSEQYTSENAFHSEQYTSANVDISTTALYSEHYYRENANYSGKDKLINSIPEVPCQSIKQSNSDRKKTESFVCRANSPSTSIAISQEPSNVSKSSHTSEIICKNLKSKDITSQNKVISRKLSQSLNNGKTNKCLDSSGRFQTDSEDLRPSTFKKRCHSGLSNSEQREKLEQTSRRKYKVKNSTGINSKPDIVTRMSLDQYEHSKVGYEQIEDKPRKLSEDMSKNWNMPLLDAINVTKKCGQVAGITSLKKENIQSSVSKQTEGLTQDTVNEWSSKSLEKRSSRGRLLKRKRFDDYDESTELNSNECKDHHYREENLLFTSSENLYSPSIEKKNIGLTNERELEEDIKNISPETKAVNPDPHDLSAESSAIKMVSQGKFEGNLNSKEYVDQPKSSQKNSLMMMSNISPKEVVQLREKDSTPLKMEDKFIKEPSEVFEVKVDKSVKEDKSEVNTACLGDNDKRKNKCMSTEDFPSDENSSTIGMSSGKGCQLNKKEDVSKKADIVDDKTNCKMGNIVLRSSYKPNYHLNHQKEKRSKKVAKTVTKEEENKSSLKKKFNPGKEMGIKNTSMITKELQTVFLEVMKDSASAEFYYIIDEARPMPMYYTIKNLEIDLKSVEMKLENDLYADAEQFLEDFRKIVKRSVDYFGPTHRISKRSRKLLNLACGLVSQRNLNLPSCPKFDLIEMLNNDNNQPGAVKRSVRAAKRKIAEKSEMCSPTKIRDESPDHVCEECGTIFAHIESYSRHCRAKSCCAKAHNRGKQMIGHTMQTNLSPPRKIYESPERIHFNLDDLVDLATAPPGQVDQLLKALDREVVACKRTVQKNKFLSALRRKARDRDIEPYRVPFPATRITARWTNHELLLAVQGVRNLGKNFQTIAQVLGTKTESQVRSFFVNYKRRYNLDSAYKEYVAEYTTTNDNEDMEVDKEKEKVGSRDVGSSKWSIPHISNLRDEMFTCKECNLQFSSEDALDDHIENDWPECGELVAGDEPSHEDENDVSRNDVPVRNPPSPEATSSHKPLSRRKRLPKKHFSFIPSLPRGVPVSHRQDDIVIDADDDNFEPPGL